VEGAERFVGREYDLDSFVERLLFSDGGSLSAVMRSCP
jgi:hypothetical protein